MLYILRYFITRMNEILLQAGKTWNIDIKNIRCAGRICNL